MTLLFRMLKRRDSDTPRTGRSGDRDFTAPDIPEVPESVPTFFREGHHVLVGRSGRRLQRNFISSHEASQALIS